MPQEHGGTWLPFDERPPLWTAQGERGLLAAVLGDAIDCFQKTYGSNDPRERKLHRESEQWIYSDDRSWWLSFRSICDVLDLDPNQIRRILSAWRTSQASRRMERSRMNSASAGRRLAG